MRKGAFAITTILALSTAGAALAQEDLIDDFKFLVRVLAAHHLCPGHHYNLTIIDQEMRRLGREMGWSKARFEQESGWETGRVAALYARDKEEFCWWADARRGYNRPELKALGILE